MSHARKPGGERAGRGRGGRAGERAGKEGAAENRV